MGVERGLLLLALVVAAIPFVIERLRRRRARPIPFPAIRLLIREQTRFSRALVLHRWRHVALRAGALALLVLAFAGPYWARPERVGRALGPGTAAVIVVDDSPFSGVRVRGSRLLDLERALVRGYLEAKAPDARIAVLGLVAAGHAPRIGLSEDVTVSRAALAGLSPLAGPEDPGALLGAARAALAASGAGRRLLIWVGARQLPAFVSAAADDLRVVSVHPAPEAPPRDVFIVDAHPEPGRLSVRVVNAGEGPWEGTLRVSLARTRRASERRLSVPAGATATEALPLPTDQGGPGNARLLGQGPLARYRSRDFVVPDSRRRPRTLLVAEGEPRDPTRDPLFYLRNALRALGEGSAARASWEDLEAAPPGAGDWVWMLLPGPLDGERLAAVRGWLDEGARVWLAFGAPPAPRTSFFGVSLVGTSAEVRRGASAPVGSADLAACLADVATRGGLLVSGHRAAGFSVLSEATDGVPLVIGRSFGAGYLVVDLSGLAPERTDLPLQPCFPAWIEGIREAAADATLDLRKRVYEEGDVLAPLPDAQGAFTASLVLPDGRQRDWEEGPVVLEDVGHHRLRVTRDGAIRAWDLVVNPRVSFDAASLEPPPEEPSEDAATVARHVDLSQAALLLALLLLAVEALLAAGEGLAWRPWRRGERGT